MFYRYGIAWGALGAAEFCFHKARVHFGEVKTTKLNKKKLLLIKLENNLEHH